MAPAPSRSGVGALTAALGLLLALLGAGCGRQAAPTVPPLPPPAIVGTSWRAEGMATSTLTFDSVTRASGSAGCNTYTAPLTISGTAVRLGPLKGGRQKCAPEIMDQERRFLGALDATRAYRLDGATLRLLDLGGREVLRLTRGESPPRGE